MNILIICLNSGKLEFLRVFLLPKINKQRGEYSMDLLQEIQKHGLTPEFLNGNFGLEKEGLRVKKPADLAESMHPSSLGNREFNPYIKTDYGEAQPELITPPLAPYWKAHYWLQVLSYILFSNLLDDEYIWPFSVPCNLPEDEYEIKISATENVELLAYREYTANKYGKKRQLISGIHINYSFNAQFLEKLFIEQDEFNTIKDLQNELYLKLASNFIRYQWLLVYLFGATPIAERSFFDGPFFRGKKLPIEPMRSLRNSQYGFINKPEILVRYNSLGNYAADLQRAVMHGKLRREREYYGDVRLRGTTKKSESLLEEGIQYLEFRTFDNNPFHATGLEKETLQFIHLFFLTLLILPEKVSFTETIRGIKYKQAVANEHPEQRTFLYKEGLWFLKEMKSMCQALDLEESYFELIEGAVHLMQFPHKTIAGRILQALEEDHSLLALGEELGVINKQVLLNDNQLPGFEHLDATARQNIMELLQFGQEVALEDIEDFRQGA